MGGAMGVAMGVEMWVIMGNLIRVGRGEVKWPSGVKRPVC